MPAKCVNCSELFDMSYDYKGETVESLAEKELGKGNKLLCWECRANANRRRNCRMN
jgi:hypothetical protein